MAVPSGTVWERDPHTAEKHALLRGYLNAWWPIILQGGFPGATYTEGFAGPGEYSGGEDGSPIEAMLALLDRDRVIHGGKPVRFVLVEERPDRVERLRQRVKATFPRLPTNVIVAIHVGTCADALIPALDHAKAWGEPIFANLDPFNTAVPFSILRRISANSSSEVLVTFMSQWLVRWAHDQGQDQGQDQGDLLFGETGWRRVVEQPSNQKKRWLVDRYRARLRDVGFRYQLAFELIEANNTAFFLIFGTSNPKGVEKMKDAMWSVDRIHGVRFRDPRDVNQIVFEIKDDPDLRGLEGLLAYHLVPGQFKTVREIRDWTLTDTVFRPQHATIVLRRWRDRGFLTAENSRRIQQEVRVSLTQRPPVSPPSTMPMFDL